MIYYLCICILAFFAVVGICESCRSIVRFFTKSDNDREILLIEPIYQKQEDAEYILRSAAQRVKWMGKNGPDRVICIDCNMDSETRKMCEIVQRDYPFIELYTREEFFNKLS